MSDLAVGSLTRGLRRSPLHSIPTVLLLGLTGGVALAMAALLRGVLFTPLPLPDAHRLVSLCERHAQLGTWCASSTPAVAALVRESASLEAGGTGRSWVFTLEEGGETLNLGGGLAGPGFFEALGVAPAVGRFPTAQEMGEEDGRVLVLGHELWQTRFAGDAGVVGRTLRLDGEPHTVVGVLPAGVEVPDIPGARLWRPLLHLPEDPAQRGWRGFVGVARLADGVPLSRAQAELEGIYGRLDTEFEEIDGSWRVQVIPLLDRVVGGVRSQLWLFGGAVALFVLIGAANVLNLFVFRRLRLRGDDAVRRALGAPARHRLSHALREGALLGVGGAVLAGVGGTLLLRLLLRLAPPQLPRVDQVAVEPVSLAVAVVLTAAVALASAGLAVRLTGSDRRLQVARTRGGGSRWLGRVRDGLVSLETALSLLLVAAAGVVGRSFVDYAAWDPGFETQGLASVQLFASTTQVPTAREAGETWRQVEELALALPGVRAAATVSAGPLFGGTETSVFFAGEGTPTGETGALPSLRWYDAGPGYFAALGRSLVAGREFVESDGWGGEPVAVVSESLARAAFPDGEVLGRTLTLPDQELTFRVVGVVADVAPLTPGTSPEAELFWSNRQLPRWGTHLVVRLEPATPVSAVESALEVLEPGVSVGTLRPLEARLEQALVRPRFLLFLMGSFAVLATLLAAGGLFAVLSVSVAERTHELGVRIALGASRKRLIRETLLRGSLVAGAGGVVGAVAFLAGEGALVASLPGVAPAGVPLLASALLLLVGAAALAALPPALRASRADPRALLREGG